MKTMKRFFAMALALVLCLGCIPAAFAAPVEEATIDTSRTGSLPIYKYDLSATRS